MITTERRAPCRLSPLELRRQLNQDQLMTLAELEHFGWELRFIRRQPFQEPVPVVFDAERRRFAVLRRDGGIDEDPGFDIRG
jgi:hypothetical protein